MTKQMSTYASQMDLRLRALERLAGNDSAAGERANSAAALSVLFELASSPATSANALALLHELQVHQVEIDMQEEELQRSRVELEASLARHIRLYDLAPFAYFTIAGDSRLCEMNLAGARLLRGDREVLVGQLLEIFLQPESGRALRGLLERVQQNGRAQNCMLNLAADAQRDLHARAILDPNGGLFLVAIVDSCP